MPERTVTMTITMPDGLQEQIDARAGKGGRSRWIREAIDAKIRAEEQAQVPERVRELEARLAALEGGNG